MATKTKNTRPKVGDVRYYCVMDIAENLGVYKVKVTEIRKSNFGFLVVTFYFLGDSTLKGASHRSISDNLFQTKGEADASITKRSDVCIRNLLARISVIKKSARLALKTLKNFN